MYSWYSVKSLVSHPVTDFLHWVPHEQNLPNETKKTKLWLITFIPSDVWWSRWIFCCSGKSTGKKFPVDTSKISAPHGLKYRLLTDCIGSGSNRPADEPICSNSPSRRTSLPFLKRLLLFQSKGKVVIEVIPDEGRTFWVVRVSPPKQTLFLWLAFRLVVKIVLCNCDYRGESRTPIPSTTSPCGLKLTVYTVSFVSSLLVSPRRSRLVSLVSWLLYPSCSSSFFWQYVSLPLVLPRALAFDLMTSTIPHRHVVRQSKIKKKVPRGIINNKWGI